MSGELETALRERIEKLRNVLLFITAYDGTFTASNAAEFWRAASKGLIADDKAAPLIVAVIDGMGET